MGRAEYPPPTPHPPPYFPAYLIYVYFISRRRNHYSPPLHFLHERGENPNNVGPAPSSLGLIVSSPHNNGGQHADPQLLSGWGGGGGSQPLSPTWDNPVPDQVIVLNVGERFDLVSFLIYSTMEESGHSSLWGGVGGGGVSASFH
jgi:hypothetical protein